MVLYRLRMFYLFAELEGFMRKIRLIALSLATVILLAFVIPIFTPALSNNVYAAGDVIEVGTYNALKTALSDFSNKNKTIKLSSSIETNEVIYIRFPVTIDLNKKSMNLGPKSYIDISTNNKDDTVTITGNGYIGGEYIYSGGILYVNKGTLVFESGTVENKPQSNGTPFNLLNKTNCYILVYSGIFISKYEWIDKVSYSLISYYYWDKDDDTGFTTSYIDYRFYSVMIMIQELSQLTEMVVMIMTLRDLLLHHMSLV